MQTLLLAVGLMLLLEGIGPMLFPNQWRRVMALLAAQPVAHLQRYGGILVVTGGVLLFWVAR